jgi:hypothetical protein
MAEGDGIEKSSGTVPDPPGPSAPAGASRSVFLSYATHDTEIANSVCQFLESRGISCWMAPRDVPAGALYADAIVRAINEAKALVVVLSQSAVGSSHVGKEIERASSKRKKIIAFRIDPTPLTPALEYFLSESQWIDVPALGMPAAMAKLAEAVGKGSAHTHSAAPVIPGGQPPSRVGTRNWIIAAVVVVIGAAVALGVHFRTSKPTAQAPAVAASSGTNAPASVSISDKSIAVLPFVDLSEKKDQEYFADGIAEEVLDRLSKVPRTCIVLPVKR